jgi:hypothetical protein
MLQTILKLTVVCGVQRNTFSHPLLLLLLLAANLLLSSYSFHLISRDRLRCGWLRVRQSTV